MNTSLIIRVCFALIAVLTIVIAAYSARDVNNLNSDLNSVTSGAYTITGGSQFCTDLGTDGSDVQTRANDAKSEWDTIVSLLWANLAVSLIGNIIGLGAPFLPESKQGMGKAAASVVKFIGVLLILAAGFITSSGDAQSFSKELDDANCYNATKAIKTLAAVAGQLAALGAVQIIAGFIQLFEFIGTYFASKSAE